MPAEVHVVQYDPRWPRLFQEERARLEPVLEPWLMGGIHHVGSTAVPGLAAKPVIDIMAGVRGLEESREAIEPLAGLSYVWGPFEEHVMHWFCKPSFDHRTHHLHLVVEGSEEWENELLFRDTLRTDGETARAYETLKRRLAVEHRHDRARYTKEKTDFVLGVLERART